MSLETTLPLYISKTSFECTNFWSGHDTSAIKWEVTKSLVAMNPLEYSVFVKETYFVILK
jgi:hypothetical protein